MAGNQVRIGVGVSDNATKPITDIRSAFRALQQDGAKGLGAGIGAAATLQAFSAAQGAVKDLSDAFLGATAAASSEEANIAKLGASLKANIPGYDGNTDAIERVVKAREDLAFSDDTLRDSLSLLVGATHDVDKAFEIQATAMDLARFKGIDLGTASEALTKVESGQFRILKSLGIVLKDGATATDALAAVQRVAGGQAKAYADTTSGAVDSLKIAFQDLYEEIGKDGKGPLRDFAKVTKDEALPAVREFGSNVIEGARIVGAFADQIDRLVNRKPDIPFTLVEKAAQGAAQGLLSTTEHADAMAAAVNTAVAAIAPLDGELIDAGISASATGTTLELMAAGATKASDEAARLKAELEAIPTLTTLEIVIRERTIAETSGSRNVEERTGTSASSGNVDGVDNAAFDQAQRERAADAKAAADKAARERQSAADKAEREAEAARNKAQREADRKAREHAQVVHEQLNAAYDKLKDTAKEAFDAIHTGNLKSIDDAHKSANAALDDQAKAIRGKVSAEQGRIDKLRDDRRERELRDNVANAAPEDRGAAVQALTDFLDDQRIARMQTDADVAIAGLDVEKQKNDAIAAADKEREDSRYKGQVKAYENDLKALKTYLDKYEGEYNEAFAHIAAEAKKAGLSAVLGIHPVAGLPSPKPAPKSGRVIGGDSVASSSAGAGRIYEGRGTQVIQLVVDRRVLAEVVLEEMAGQSSLRTPNAVSTGSMR